jgi:hypothetical protein
MIPIMGKGLAKTMFQFQSFAFHAWSKSLLFGLNHRDTASLLTVAYGSMIAALAYSVRSALQVAGKSEEERERFLNERFSAKQIVASSFGRLAQASLAPQIFDTLSPWPLFAGMRTTADVSDLAANPTLQLVNGALSGMKLVRNAVSGTEQTSAADVRALSRLLPLNNLVGIQNVLNAVASEFPSSGTQTE